MPTKIRTIIVDDERVARQGLQILLQSEPDVEVVAECRNGREAVAAIRRERPDLVLLDIQMPGMSGFEVVEQVGVGTIPALIFVTAYDEHALKAFEIHALDYLLKPFDQDRLRASLDRIRLLLRRDGLDELRDRLSQLVNRLERRDDAGRFVVRDQGRIYFIDADEVDWIESAGNYVQLHVGGKTHLMRQSLSSLEQNLAPRFVRVHRSALVNAERVAELHPLFKGAFEIVLRGGAKVRSSRSCRGNLERLLNLE